MISAILGSHQTQSPPESPRPGTGPPTPSDASGKEPWLGARHSVRTIGGEPRQANPVPGMLAYRPPPFLPHMVSVPILMQIPPVPPKRSSHEEEEGPSAPRKKPRTSRAKADGSVGKWLFASEREASLSNMHSAPKRGYTAKKRNEAAQIAAQNGQSFPTSAVAPD